ncbi:MAG: hypothetical protein E7037_02050 [Verrucomicrobia bacterium]|nr:hypothetical protein [Verrucomicrobiota bacterium]
MNDALLITLIICAAIVAIVAIVFGFCSQRKANTNMEAFLNQRNVKLHRNYIVGFLCAAVILLATSKCVGNGSEIFSYISFASTITSIVLSILAIFVTVQSSADINRQFAKIEDATNAVSDASRTLSDTLSKISDAEKQLESKSEALGTQIGKIAEEFHRRVNVCMHEAEERIVTRVASNSKNYRNQESKGTEKEQPNAEVKGWIERRELAFLECSSLCGLFSLYACSLSMEKKKKFKLEGLFSESKDYVYGFLVATVCALHLSLENADGEFYCSQIAWNKEDIANKLERRIDENKGEDKEALCAIKKKIDDFFDI